MVVKLQKYEENLTDVLDFFYYIHGLLLLVLSSYPGCYQTGGGGGVQHQQISDQAGKESGIFAAVTAIDSWLRR